MEHTASFKRRAVCSEQSAAQQERKYPSFEMAAAPLHEEPDQRTRKATAAACGPGQGLSVLERLLMGLLKVEDLASKGIQLSEEEMNLYHRIKNGHSR